MQLNFETILAIFYAIGTIYKVLSGQILDIEYCHLGTLVLMFNFVRSLFMITFVTMEGTIL